MLPFGPVLDWARRARARPDPLSGRRAAVDLVGLLRGGDHGGQKVVALELVRVLRRAAPALELLILTGRAAHDELAGLEAPGVTRVCVEQIPEEWAALRVGLAGPRPTFVLSPLGRPSTHVAGLPVVALATALEHLRHPERLSDFERAARARELEAWAPGCLGLLCRSEAEAAALARVPGVDPRRVSVVPLKPEERLALHGNGNGQPPAPYLFYPANYWPHKNHRLLLVAYGARLAQGAALPRLVCAGAAEPLRQELVEMARCLGLHERVSLLPSADDAQLAALYHGCAGVLLPWLYAGEALPVAEAARFARPIACSRFTDLPAGLRARTFDPRRVDEIGAALTDWPPPAALGRSAPAEPALLRALGGALLELERAGLA